MAQIKRKKVKNKGQKKSFKSLLKNKKFWIIFSSVVAGLIVIGVTIGLIVYFVTKDDENEIQDYFGGEATNLSYEYEGANGKYNVQFTKISYAGLCMHNNVNEGSDDTFEEYIFVFATDLSTFYADEAIDDGKDKTDDDVTLLYNKEANKVFAQLVKFQGVIDDYKAKSQDDIKVNFYIVDTSIDDNNSIYADTRFGFSEDGSDGDVSALFALINEDGIVEDFLEKDTKKSKTIKATDFNAIYSTAVNNAITFIKQDFKSEDK